MNVGKCYCDGALLLQDEIVKSNHSWYVERKKGQRLNLYELGVVAFFVSGVVSIYNKKTDLLILEFEAPCIIGLLALKYSDETYYAITKTTCIIYSIKLENVREIINRNNLWRAVFNIITIHMYHYTKIESIFNRKNAMDIVRESINYINEISPSLRDNVSLYNFILSRCTMSRSAIYNEIKKLDLDSITINRGLIK